MLLAALLLCAARRLKRDAMPGPAPLDNRALIQRAKAGDVWAAFVLARRTRCRSVTQLVQAVYPASAPSVQEADVLLDAWSLWQAEQDDGRSRAMPG